MDTYIKVGWNCFFQIRTKYFKLKDDEEPVFHSEQGQLTQVGKLYGNQIYHQQKDVGDWHGIQYGDELVYIHKSKITPVLNKPYQISSNHGERSFTTIKSVDIYLSDSGVLSPYVHLNEGQHYTINSNYGNWYKVVVAGREAFVLKNAVREEFTSQIKYFKTIENVVVYNNQSGSLKPVGTLKAGQAFTRVKDYGNWHQIRFGTQYGYVLKRSTIPAMQSDLMSVSNGMVIGSGNVSVDATVYDNRTGTLIPFATLNKGQSVKVTQKNGNWYEINVSGRKGYVSSSTISDYQPFAKDVVDPRQVYTYEEMKRDIGIIREMYPDLIHTSIIGKSVDGRNIYAVKLGSGETEITINGSHHAREHMTTNVLMEMIDQYAQAYSKNQLFNGYNARDILNKTSIWFVPMVNPDGVSLVQMGHKSAKNPGYVLSLNGGSSNFSAWKANVRGVDLNRQYPLHWSEMESASKAGPDNYKGPRALSEPETKAMYDFTMSRDFKTAVAYHSSGEILYWSYVTDGEVMKQNKKIADSITNKTGYTQMTPVGKGFAYYDDWFLSQFRRPAFTPEISPYAGANPVPVGNFDSIWKKNDSVGLMLAQEAYTNRNDR